MRDCDISRWSVTILSVLFVAGIVGCDDPPAGEPDEYVEETAERDPPRWQHPDTRAEEVAAEVFVTHGGPARDDIDRIQFRFVVESDGQSVFEAEHDWDLDAGTDRVIWEDDGEVWSVLVDLDDRRTVEASVDDTPVDEEELENAADQGYRRWVNDTYWLLMPIKLFDPGVELALDEAVDFDGQQVDVLELSFDDVGLTPGDRYRVMVDRESREILGWEMMLEGRDGSTIVDWSDYQNVGPLNLPVEKTWRDEDRRIVFEDVRIETESELSEPTGTDDE